MNIFTGKIGQVIKGKGFLNLFQFLKKLQKAADEMLLAISRTYTKYMQLVEATENLEQLYVKVNSLQLQLYKDILGTMEGFEGLYLQEITPSNPFHGKIPYNKGSYSWEFEYYNYNTKYQTGVLISGSEDRNFCEIHNRVNQYGILYQNPGCMHKMQSFPTAVQNLINYFGGYNDKNR